MFGVLTRVLKDPDFKVKPRDKCDLLLSAQSLELKELELLDEKADINFVRYKIRSISVLYPSREQVRSKVSLLEAARNKST